MAHPPFKVTKKNNLRHLLKVVIRAAHGRPNYPNMGSNERMSPRREELFLETRFTRVGEGQDFDPNEGEPCKNRTWRERSDKGGRLE